MVLVRARSKRVQDALKGFVPVYFRRKFSSATHRLLDGLLEVLLMQGGFARF